MQQRKTEFPVGTSTGLMPSEESMSSYMGLTREQKREILTHSLVNGQQGVLLHSDTAQRR